jgi:glyoxylase-like metal-dependent hydrolase (beta-lactamase superfamily II)
MSRQRNPLIDTGTKWDESRRAAGRVGRVGLKIQILQRIVITPHADHYGLAAEIWQASGAEVWTHRHNRAMLEAYETIRAQRDEFYKQLMTEAGVPLEQRQRVAESRRGGNRYAEVVGSIRCWRRAMRSSWPIGPGGSITRRGMRAG